MSEQTTQETQEQQIEQTSEIDLSAYESIKNDMHKYKRQLMEAQKEKAEYEAKMKELEEERLKNSEDYKGLYEKSSSELNGWKEKYLTLNKNLVENNKMNAIKDAAVKAGIDPDFVDMLDAFDTSDVMVETTESGKFIVNGADTWVNALKADRPKMFKQKVDPSFNNKSGNYDGREKTYSHAEVLKLQKENPDKYRDIIINKRHLITK